MELVHVLIDKMQTELDLSGLLVHLLRLILHPAPWRSREALDNDRVLLCILAARSWERQRCGSECQEQRGCMQETHVGSCRLCSSGAEEGGWPRERESLVQISILASQIYR